MSERENVKWFAKNLKLYDFLTPEALELKHEVQEWTAEAAWDDDKAVSLLRRYRRMAQAGPVEIRTGLYKGGRAGGKKKSTENTYALQMMRGKMSSGAIIPKSRGAFYSAEQKRFVGETALNTEDSQACWKNVIDASTQKVESILQSAEKEFNSELKEVKGTRLLALYGPGRNFRLLKALISAAMVISLVRIFPMWWVIVVSLLVMLFAGNFSSAWTLLNDLSMTLGGTPSDQPQQLLLLAVILLSVPVYVLSWKQLFWEIWFFFYRVAAKIAMRRSVKRFSARMKRLRGAVTSVGEELARMVAIEPGKGLDLSQVVWAPPAWIRVGENPRFSLRKLKQFGQNFTVYPIARPKGKYRSIGFFAMLAMAIVIFLLYLTIDTGAAEVMMMLARRAV